jgi:hypothetical protein
VSKMESPGRCEPLQWLLLVHQLPAKPAYQRVKVWRRLQALGAVTVKNSVYVLPTGEQAQEDFEWLLKEIADGGGEGMIFEARLIDGLSDEDVRGLFNAARAQDYDALAGETRALSEAFDGSDAAAVRAAAQVKLIHLRTDVAKVAAIDFFGANGRETVEGLLAGLEARLREDAMMTTGRQEQAPEPLRSDTFKGRLWVTRRGVYVDRIASAWLIRRFIDPEARFKFVPAKGYVPEPGELRFDMYDGEYTHQGDCCTFEVLLAHTGREDPALSALGEIVHDIDLKDSKFGRPETTGVAHLMKGITAANRDDQRRLERGAAVFDDFYEYFRSERS